MMKLRKIKENKKGFTLIEVIVVLVIIAILAALLIPALTGYISKANDSAAIAEARTVLVALQAEASEGEWGAADDEDSIDIEAVEKLSELTVDGNLESLVIDTNSKILSFTYTSTDGRTVNYISTDEDKFSIAEEE